MTIRNDSRARVPGPLGPSPGGVAGRIPGPLRFASIVFMAPAAVAKAVKTTTMPPPTNDQDNKDVHEVTWPLFNPSKKVPAFSEVKQAPCSAGLHLGGPHLDSGHVVRDGRQCSD